MDFSSQIDRINQEIISYSSKMSNDIFNKKKVLIINEISDLLKDSDLKNRLEVLPSKKGRPSHKKTVNVIKKRKKTTIIKKKDLNFRDSDHN